MTDLFLLNVGQAIVWTFVTYIVASFYWSRGRAKGINDVVQLFNSFEPEASRRIFNKMKAKTNAALNE